MNKLLRSILFLSIFIIIGILLSFLLKYYTLKLDPNEKKVVDMVKMHDRDYDGLFLGNSLTFYAFDPTIIDSITNLNTYNLAIGGATITSMFVLLDDYLLKNYPPDFIVLGLYLNNKEWGDNIRPSIRKSISKNSIEKYNRFLRENNIDNDWKENLFSYFNIYQYRRVIDRIFKIIIEPYNYKFKLINGHYVSSKNIEPIFEYPSHAGGINKHALKNFIDYCIQKNINVLLVELPNHKAYNEATINRAEVLSDIYEVLNEKVEFISFNNPENYTEQKDWHSLNHLNKWGSRKFSVEFGNYLQRNKSIVHK